MKLYDIIEKAIRQHKDSIHLEDGVTESEVRHAIRWVMRDNPNIFWFVHQYQFDKGKREVSLRYQFSQKRRALIQKSIDDVVENDFQINQVRSLITIEQVAYVYKWLLTYCNYNVNSAYNQNIDSVFVRRNSVCTGYAKAAQYLFRLLGIESRLVFGRLNNDREDGRHCWNIVCVNGTHYHLDVSLGDLSLGNVLKNAGNVDAKRYGVFNYSCFCVSTKEIQQTRTIEDLESLPSCNNNLDVKEVNRLSEIKVLRRKGMEGCLLTPIGSSADIFLCADNKQTVLKKFREGNSGKCAEEYGYMTSLTDCPHLIHVREKYSNVTENVIAIEQSTPIVDLFCSHYYHPTLYGILHMVRDITIGWQECYQKGIMYRDIHVCNIYKANDGLYKLGDFGSCTYELQGLRERVGNLWFMSPETYISGQFDERSAVYSLAAVLYFVLNGLIPPLVNGNNEEEALWKKLNGVELPVPSLLLTFPKSVSEAIMNVLVRGCAYYPSRRIRTTRAFLHEIDRLLKGIKGQNIAIRFTRQNTMIIPDDTRMDIDIPRDVYHRFAYGEEVERVAITAAPWLIDSNCAKRWAINNNGSNEEFSLNCIPQDFIDLLLEGNDSANVTKPESDEVENYCRTMGIGEPNLRGRNNEIPRCIPTGCSPSETRRKKEKEKHSSSVECDWNAKPAKLSLLSRLFKKRADNVYSSIFAPAEVNRKSHMLVQVYLHLYEETEKVKALAQESQKDAERRDYIPLQCKLKKGDKVDVQLNIYGETLLMTDKKSVVWQGSFTKCSFDYFVPKDIDVDELSCMAQLMVNGVPIGEMRFITKIVDEPRRLNPEIIAHKYNKVFISYAHKDEARVKSFHEGLKLAGIEHFFDRNYLKAGDIFPQVIQDYINSADLFVLFWSENASKSEYVEKERAQALLRAFPQVKPQQAAKLSIYPMSIEPRTELPADMRDYYHFGEI